MRAIALENAVSYFGIQPIPTVDYGVVFDAPLPTYSYEQIAHYLTDGFWEDNGLSRAGFELDASRSISVNLTGLTEDGISLAMHGLEAWTMVSGIEFDITTDTAQITFDDQDEGAFSIRGTGVDGFISASFINVDSAYASRYGTDIATPLYLAYVHEIGHALGLGHAGNYNGSATYRVDDTEPGDNHYLNDSERMTVMSYFPVDWLNGYGSTDLTVTPMIADILAVQDLYGVWCR